MIPPGASENGPWGAALIQISIAQPANIPDKIWPKSAAALSPSSRDPDMLFVVPVVKTLQPAPRVAGSALASQADPPLRRHYSLRLESLAVHWLRRRILPCANIEKVLPLLFVHFDSIHLDCTP